MPKCHLLSCALANYRDSVAVCQLLTAMLAVHMQGIVISYRGCVCIVVQRSLAHSGAPLLESLDAKGVYVREIDHHERTNCRDPGKHGGALAVLTATLWFRLY